MALSNVSAVGSMIGQMIYYAPDTGGILAEDQVAGVIWVTEIVVSRCEAVGDLQGRGLVMIGAEAEGQMYGGFTLTEDMVLVLGESAQGIYVIRGLRASLWLKVLEALRMSPKVSSGFKREAIPIKNHDVQSLIRWIHVPCPGGFQTGARGC